MLFQFIIGFFIILGIISYLPLRASLFASGLLLTGGLSYFIIIPIVKYGVFPTGFFISAVILMTLFTWITINNNRVVKAERIRQDQSQILQK